MHGGPILVVMPRFSLLLRSIPSLIVASLERTGPLYLSAANPVWRTHSLVHRLRRSYISRSTVLANRYLSEVIFCPIVLQFWNSSLRDMLLIAVPSDMGASNAAFLGTLGLLKFIDTTSRFVLLMVTICRTGL